MKCEKCGYDYNGTGDTAHFCKRGGVTLKDLIGEMESIPEGKADLDDARKVVAMAAELNRLRARVAELEAGDDVELLQKQRDELLMILEETASYIDQTYSDLIGHHSAEWLAARYADDLLPKIKSVIVKNKGKQNEN